MRDARIVLIFRHGLLVIMVGLAIANAAWAGSKYKVLYSFQGGNDGAAPHAGVVRDAQGNLYGTTGGGGVYSSGTVYRLTPQPDGTWAESVLHSFNYYEDGAYPQSAVILDESGNLYGTTDTGDPAMGGTVFELSPGRDDWQETILYTFCSKPNCADGGAAWASLLLDKAGKLYGTTKGGGPLYGGVVFELTPGNDAWSETILHSFDGEHQSNDGSTSYAGLIFDATGNLYGTTSLGGKFDAGTVFELMPQPDGSWKEHRLHNFGAFPHDGHGPGTEVIFDSFGDLYGTTASGGRNICVNGNGCGTVFKLSPTPDGRWEETILYNFTSGKDGNFPNSRLVFDAAGNLYGTAVRGGNDSCGCGVLFKLAPQPDGTWTYTTLRRFHGADGALPKGVIVDKKGHLFGTTQLGGAYDSGVVYELKQ